MKPVKSPSLSNPQAAEAELRRLQRRYEGLKARLARLGYVCQGTLSERYLPCGKPNCVCHQDPSKRHGPYTYWTRKVDGRTQTRMIPASVVSLYRKGIQNHQRLKTILTEMQEVSLQAFEAVKNRSKR